MILSFRIPQSAAILFALACFISKLHAQPTDDARLQIHSIIETIQNRVNAGNTNETDFKTEFKKLDDLAARQNEETNSEVAAEIIYTKAMLLNQLFNDFGQATNLMLQLKNKYPNSLPAHDADAIIADINRHAVNNKIQDNLAPGTPLPAFTVTNLDGTPVATSDYKGKVLLVDFWATWCPPCRAELPNIVNIYKNYHTQGFEIIGISLEREMGNLSTFIKDHNMPWPQYCVGQGWTNAIAEQFGIDAIPATILVGRDGKIIGKNLFGADLEAAVTKALKQ